MYVRGLNRSIITSFDLCGGVFRCNFCLIYWKRKWIIKMSSSIDLILKPACSGCGSTAELYGSNCKHLTLCVSCGKSMAEKRTKCFDCGATITRLIRVLTFYILLTFLLLIRFNWWYILMLVILLYNLILFHDYAPSSN